MLPLMLKPLELLLLALMLVFCTGLLADAMDSGGNLQKCQPTAPDEMGPFYRPGAPVRAKIGRGYFLRGAVLSAATCRPLPAALIEFWQAGPNGRYADAYRATIIADRQGGYQLETDPPPPYVSRPPHIHIRVAADGFQTLVTQHYLQKGNTAAIFDLVLLPAR